LHYRNLPKRYIVKVKNVENRPNFYINLQISGADTNFSLFLKIIKIYQKS
jgi:hypothetical protein